MKYLVIAFLLFNLTGIAQIRTHPKLIKTKGDYSLKAAKAIFPSEINQYARKSIYANDKKGHNVIAKYRSSESSETEILVNIYPANEGFEGRLRNEYLKSLQSISDIKNEELYADQFPAKRKGEKYICNGFTAVINSEHKTQHRMTLFECGTWFLKITITSPELNTAEMDTLETKILDIFDPTKLTESNLLNTKSELLIAPSLGSDRATLVQVMKGAFKKLEWANENVPDNERVSGFPDIYLEMHIESLKEFAATDKGNEVSNLKENKTFIAELNKIIEAGFLAEFIMEQYQMVMMVPKTLELDFSSYEKWQKQTKTSIDLHKFFYLIKYPKA